MLCHFASAREEKSEFICMSWNNSFCWDIDTWIVHRFAGSMHEGDLVRNCGTFPRLPGKVDMIHLCWNYLNKIVQINFKVLVLPTHIWVDDDLNPNCAECQDINYNEEIQIEKILTLPIIKKLRRIQSSSSFNFPKNGSKTVLFHIKYCKRYKRWLISTIILLMSNICGIIHNHL